MNTQTYDPKLENNDPWEGGSNLLTNSKLSYFRIYSVDAENRLCDIKTFGPEESVSNGSYQDVQWLALYSSPEGDEISFVPRLGSIGVCAFLGSQPHILGFYNPLTIDENETVDDLEQEGIEKKIGGSAAGKKEKLNPGDFILRTVGNCRLVLRAGGEIELEATKVCRRTYFPARNRITEISQNLEIDTDSCSLRWVHVDQDASSEETISTQIWKDDVSSTNIVKDEKGTIEDSSNLIHRFQIAPGSNVNESLPTANDPVYLRETYADGKTEFKINDTAFHELTLPTGEYSRGIGEKKHLTEIKPTGETHININKKYDRKTLDTGETIINIADKFNLKIEPSGAITIDVAGKATFKIEASGETKLDVGPGKSTVTIKPDGEVEIKTNTKVVCDTTKVELKADKIELGSAVSDVVPLGKLLVAAINEFIAKYNAHTHDSPFLGLPTTPTKESTLAIIGEAVLSKTVKVQP